MKNLKNNLNKPLASIATKKLIVKNLSPAKKFRLRLRRAKFQRQQQDKDDYFEHDNRGIAKVTGEQKKKKTGRLYKKDRRAQMYIDAYLKSQHEHQLNRNGDNASQDETQDSSNGNEVSLKSIVNIANIGLSSPFTHALAKEQAIHDGRLFSSMDSSAKTRNISTVKCCCHCACSERKKKTRNKLRSPYFGDFHRTMGYSKGNCAKEMSEVTNKILNETTTTTHHETMLKASEIINYKKLSLNPNTRMRHEQMLSVFKKNYDLQSQSGSVGCGLGKLRSVLRFVL